MVVDDEEPIAEALAIIIESAGYDTVVATRSQVAIDTVETGTRPALIITDFMMPQMNGAVLIGRLRSLLGAAMPPVVMTSAAGGQRAAAAGADAFLPKPFEFEEVEDLLERFLGGA